MKKRVFLACLVGLLTATSAYSACDGGTEITNTAGTTFCKSNVEMNWWSAANWCKANGMHLATMYEICPSWDGNNYGKCPELGSLDGWIWTSTASGQNSTFIIVSGSIANSESDARRSNTHMSAFCR